MSNLLSNLIRLAHEQPKLRGKILPVLKEAMNYPYKAPQEATPETKELIRATQAMKLALANAFRRGGLKTWAKADMYLREWNAATSALVSGAIDFDPISREDLGLEAVGPAYAKTAQTHPVLRSAGDDLNDALVYLMEAKSKTEDALRSLEGSQVPELYSEEIEGVKKNLPAIAKAIKGVLEDHKSTLVKDRETVLSIGDAI